MNKFINNAVKIMKKNHPELGNKLKQAGMIEEPEEYIKKNIMLSIYLGLGLSFIAFLFTQNPITFLFAAILIPLCYLYFQRYVDVKITRIRKQVDSEIVYAGNFLMIELDAGVPMHKAFENLEKNYKYLGTYFGDIMNKVYLGTSLDDAVSETMNLSPSANLRRIMWQIMNSIKTGSNPTPALQSVINNIVREQRISVKEYGKKLSPMAMFYMMISIIVPSLGITMLVVFATFLGLNVTLPFFLVIALFIGFVQFMFLSMIKSMRPPISV